MMKTKTNNRKIILSILVSCFITCANFVWSQTVCTDNINTVYGFTTTGGIYPINVNTAAVGTIVGTLNDGTANGPVNANGFGYNSVNNRFYGFYRCQAGTAPLSEFISYNPTTNTTTKLAGTPPGTAVKIRSGCVNNTGSGYYCMEITTSPVAANLWYYNFITSTWTKITSSFKNGATDYTSNFQNYNSGDMAFDGYGNLWMVISNSATYAMYKIVDPVPTTVQTSVTVQQMIPPTATPAGGGVSFTGLAFNANGIAYLTTGSGAGANNNKLYRMSTAASGLVYVATLPLNSAGDDLTSCIFSYALPVKWLGFLAEPINQKGIQLKWHVRETPDVKQYLVERSIDATNWQKLALVQRQAFPDHLQTQYSYIDYEFVSGRIYYRVIMEDETGKTSSSGIREVIVNDQNIRISPNPANDKITIRQNGTVATRAEIFDAYGKLVLSTPIHYANETINVSNLAKGHYFLKLSFGTTELTRSSFIKL